MRENSQTVEVGLFQASEACGVERIAVVEFGGRSLLFSVVQRRG